MSGDKSNEVTPVPIPNTEVKLICADGTADCCGRVGRRQTFLFISPDEIVKQWNPSYERQSRNPTLHGSGRAKF